MAELFPYTLYGLLNDVANVDQQQRQLGLLLNQQPQQSFRSNTVIGWTRGGKAFCIFDPHTFERSYLPLHFPSLLVWGAGNALTMFVAQLTNDWGFTLEADGSFVHPYFQRDNVGLLQRMRRSGMVSRNNISANGSVSSALSSPTTSLTGHLNNNVRQNLAAILLQQIVPGGVRGIGQQQHPSMISPQGLVLPPVITPVSPTTAASAIVGGVPTQLPMTPSALVAAIATNLSNPATIATQSIHAKPSTVRSAISNDDILAKLGVRNDETTKDSMIPDTVVTSTQSNYGSVSISDSDSDSGPSTEKNPKKRSKSSPVVSTSNKKMKKTNTNKKKQKRDTVKLTKDLSPFSFHLNEDLTTGSDDNRPCLLFPWKLHDLLDESESDDCPGDEKAIISWKEDGTSFAVHDQDKLVEKLLPRHFKSIDTWDGFTEILEDWGFVQFASGPQAGSFFHRLFNKDKRSLYKQMRIQGKTVSEWMKRHDQFLPRLHALLDHINKTKTDQSVAFWSPNGKEFIIEDSTAFMNMSLEYFDSMTYGSFEQKLRRWGFIRTPSKIPLDKEIKVSHLAFHHPLFTKSREAIVQLTQSIKDLPSTTFVRPDAIFLVRLRIMLDNSSKHGYQFVASWLSHGKSFIIHDRAMFSDIILPLYFRGKFSSFRQSLRNHGFGQMGATNEWDEGAHYHKLFIRDAPKLCLGLTPEQMKQAMPDWTPASEEPNFYDETKSQSPTPCLSSLPTDVTPAECTS